MSDRQNKGKRDALVQFIKFGLVGVSNTVVSYVVYALVIYFLGTDYYLLASVLSFIISVLNAYIWQNIFVFKEEEGAEKRIWWKVLIKTYIAYSFTGLILNNLLLLLWIEVVDISKFAGPVLGLLADFGIVMTAKEFATYAAPIMNMVVSIPLNFVINKFWAYRQKDKKEIE